MILEALPDLFKGFLLPQLGLRVELVGKADNLLLQTLRSHIPVRNGQFFPDDGLQTQTGSGMPFAHQSVLGKPLQCEQFPAQITVADVG